MATKMNQIQRALELAATIRGATLDEAEKNYRQLRDELSADFQHISGSQGRSRTHEIARLRSLGENEKADWLEEDLEYDMDSYDERALRKSLLAVRAGRLVSFQIGSLVLTGTQLIESRRGSGKFDNCGQLETE